MESLPVDQARAYYEREFCAIAPPAEPRLPRARS